MSQENSFEVERRAGEDCEVTFTYLQWNPLFLKEKPFELLVDLPPEHASERRTNLTFAPGSSKEKVRSARGKEADFHVDIHGFALRKHETAFRDWTNREQVGQFYIPEMEQFIRQEIDDVDKVYTYDWRVREHQNADVPVILIPNK